MRRETKKKKNTSHEHIFLGQDYRKTQCFPNTQEISYDCAEHTYAHAYAHVTVTVI